MIEMLKSWEGSVDINGTIYDNITLVPKDISFEDDWYIRLLPKNQKTVNNVITKSEDESETKKEYLITVKKYMTETSSPGFDFMAKWNDNVPMPMRMMAGTIEKETPGLYYMKLHGTMYAEKMTTCMCCGRKLTNPVSQYVGMGPECGRVIHMSLTEEDMANIDEMVKEAKTRLQEVTWEGWCIKSAITEMVEVTI